MNHALFCAHQDDHKLLNDAIVCVSVGYSTFDPP